MQPRKRKYEKVDITKRKVQYIVDVQFKSSEPNEMINKKGPELVKIDYDPRQDMPRHTRTFMQFNRNYNMSGNPYQNYKQKINETVKNNMQN